MNDKSGIIVMLIIAFVAIAACAGTILYINSRNSKPEETVENIQVELKVEEDSEIENKTAAVKKESEFKTVVARETVPLTEDAKKAKEAKEWEEAGKEMYEIYQGSKMQELIQKKMNEGNKQWFSELFEKYNISPENQEIIASAVTEAQTEFFNELMANGFLKDADEEKRAQVSEKLNGIDTECEEVIKLAGGEAFLEASKERRKTELRDQYLNGVNFRLGKNKMSDKQRNAMDALYAANQVTEAEVWILPKSEIDERKENINSGAKSILDEEQYEQFITNNRDPFNFK